MILTKEVKVYYNGQARQYYESKGYIFPKQWVKFNHTHNRMVYRPVRGSYIIVPISDLNPNSNTDIEWKCDLCDNIGHTTYKRYLQSTLNRIKRKQKKIIAERICCAKSC